MKKKKLFLMTCHVMLAGLLIFCSAAVFNSIRSEQRIKREQEMSDLYYNGIATLEIQKNGSSKVASVDVMSDNVVSDLMMELVTLRKGRVPNKSEDWTYVLTGYDRNNAKQYVITVYDSYISSEGRTYKTTEQFMGYLKTLWRNKT
ncbi:MAG: hypothetical protein IJS38_03210 [Erysipelotrichaceae bacterium]|nr:hypothetical protein [Erysipelotrichaceae bacterium]